MRSLICCALFLATLQGCSTFGTNQSRDVQIQEGKKEVTKSASETDLNTERTKPLVDATGSHGSTINLDIQGPLPVEKVRGRQSKEASEDTIMDMTIKETWEQFSGWVYLILAVAALVGVRALRQLESTKTFKIAESSISGGLRVFGSVIDKIDQDLIEMDTHGTSYKDLKSLRDHLAAKEGRLKAKSKSL